MNVDTGHLIDISGMTPDQLLKLQQSGYQPIPPELDQAARSALAGQKETTVNLTSASRLARWAAERRRAKRLAETKQKARRKMAKASQKKNRGRG